VELLRDFAAADPDGYHRFLWSHHLAYADTYDAARRCGPENLNATRRLLFDDLAALLAARGPAPTDVRAVLEVGCSLGYLLRHLETALFPHATALDGIDIDRRAIAEGRDRLARDGSRVRLYEGDMAALASLVGARRYDVVLCAGTLMYLREAPAADVVAALLARTQPGGVLVLAGLAHPERDNAALEASVPRTRDGTWIHNLDAMVARGGGRVLRRRWEGARLVDGNTVYFVFAEPH
jgi:SAM-dependent methyltransferase